MTPAHPPPGRPTAAPAPADVLDRVAEFMRDTPEPLGAPDREALADLLPRVEHRAAAEDVVFDPDRRLALAVHLAAYVRRTRTGERLDPLDPSLFAEIGPARRRAAHAVLADHRTRIGEPPTGPEDAEVLLLALHFETAWQAPSDARPIQTPPREERPPWQ